MTKYACTIAYHFGPVAIADVVGALKAATDDILCNYSVENGGDDS